MPFQFRKEAIEEDLNSNFPSQGQGNPPLYYSLSEVVVPTYSINSVTEGSGLPENLQTAWDFSTGNVVISNGTSNIITNTGFWLVEANLTMGQAGNQIGGNISITDGLTSKPIWVSASETAGTDINFNVSFKGVVFVRSGDTVTGNTAAATNSLFVNYRQIADLNGNLVNPLGFSFA